MAAVDTNSHTAILAALTRSRTALLFEALPLFSTKSRSKTAPQLVQPPHTITALSTSTISIGPHSFSRTKLFVVEWATAIKKKVLPPPPPPPAPASSTSITPALINRLNAASAADPLLASFLRKAAAGLASSQELAGLARYIEAMRRDEEATNPTPPPAPAPTPQPVASTSGTPTTEETRPPPSIVIEFRESQNERFIFPSHYSFDLLPVDAASGNNGRRSALLSFFVFPQDKGKGKKKDDGTNGLELGTPVPISLVVEDCTEAVRGALLRASRTGRDRDESVEAWVRKMIAAVPPRIPIVHRPRDPTPELISPVVSRAASFIAEAPTAVKPGETGAAVSTPKAKPKRIRNRKAAISRAKSSSAPVTATATPELELAPPTPKPARVRNRPPTKRKPSAKALEAMEMEEEAMKVDEQAVALPVAS